MPIVTVNRDLCKGCERCLSACPQGIIRMAGELNPKGYFPAEVFDQPRCLGCTLCAIACPDVAIEIEAFGTRYRYFEY